MNTKTPILDAVRAMHREEDTHAARKIAKRSRELLPYGPAAEYVPLTGTVTPEQVREAEQILACYETTLEIAP